MEGVRGMPALGRARAKARARRMGWLRGTRVLSREGGVVTTAPGPRSRRWGRGVIGLLQPPRRLSRPLRVCRSLETNPRHYADVVGLRVFPVADAPRASWPVHLLGLEGLLRQVPAVGEVGADEQPAAEAVAVALRAAPQHEQAGRQEAQCQQQHHHNGRRPRPGAQGVRVHLGVRSVRSVLVLLGTRGGGGRRRGRGRSGHGGWDRAGREHLDVHPGPGAGQRDGADLHGQAARQRRVGERDGQRQGLFGGTVRARVERHPNAAAALLVALLRHALVA